MNHCWLLCSTECVTVDQTHIPSSDRSAVGNVKPLLVLMSNYSVCVSVYTEYTACFVWPKGCVCSTPSETMSCLTHHTHIRKHTRHSAVKWACCCLTVTFNMSASLHSHFLRLLYLSSSKCLKKPQPGGWGKPLAWVNTGHTLKRNLFSKLWQSWKKKGVQGCGGVLKSFGLKCLFPALLVPSSSLSHSAMWLKLIFNYTANSLKQFTR